MKVAEEVLQLLKPLKTVTTLLSTENAPSVSMILPLKTRILQSICANEEDSSITGDVKAAIRGDLISRYTDPPDIQDYIIHRVVKKEMSRTMFPSTHNMKCFEEKQN